MLVISAFDPQSKKSQNNNNLIEYICNQNFNGEIIYISTARIGTSEKKYEAYAQNKLQQETYLKNYFKSRVFIKRLPILIPSIRSKFKGGFLGFMRNSMANGNLVFDVNIASSWNFIFIDDLLKRLFIKKSECLMSRHSVTALDFILFYSREFDVSLKASETISSFVNPNDLPTHLLHAEQKKSEIIERIDNVIRA